MGGMTRHIEAKQTENPNNSIYVSLLKRRFEKQKFFLCKILSDTQCTFQIFNSGINYKKIDKYIV